MTGRSSELRNEDGEHRSILLVMLAAVRYEHTFPGPPDTAECSQTQTHKPSTVLDFVRDSEPQD